MAILRGGVRIGGFDIRLGLPRDRSLENVSNDPRFREKPFPVSADNISDDPRFTETKNRNLNVFIQIKNHIKRRKTKRVFIQIGFNNNNKYY